METGFEFAWPILGVSHLVAAIAAGLWGGMLGGQAPWLLPASFVLGMAMGYVVGSEGLFLVHAGILLGPSMMALVTAVALKVRLPVDEAVGTVGLIGLVHGVAQGGAAGLMES